ncbi:MAG TPA: glycoside hydrolase family 38 C-terminal domain-containing protein [Planctomycetota bacterium]|jgi:alpha-mannosidase|nr:alpha-mannosidase [Planctomycetota bacterium]OQC22351.1 MAG: alpha-mannosidase [Planctomycetes bacterium ADurb.Bin069]NMD35712.1 alpha-mannosidase [Planctomycetota bacterium]HNR98816.1 glycoside hydrolase family 38 C-terminal domain-containing protein [Planctomycetota bacterium]HNU26592.1 glycoside hydrolase family 38 C-terminal domain-containing protein [Planctomycetota bacterium]
MCAYTRWSIGVLCAAVIGAAPVAGAAVDPYVPTAAEKKALRVHVIPQAAIELAGAWRYDPEAIEECAVPALAAAVRNLAKFPSYSFSVAQVPLLEPLENRAPDLWKSVVALVAAGRMEVAGGNYLEFDGACVGGEALVRQFSAGREFLRGKLGQGPRICWSLGTVAHPWTLPQILRKSEIDTYVFLRGAPRPTFLWEGIDGSKVLAVRPLTGAGVPEAVAAALERFRADGITQTCLLVGAGDHGGGLAEKDIEELQAAFAAAPIAVGFGRADAFSALCLGEIDKLPVVHGELGFELPGAYTTLGRIKEHNRVCEQMLLAAEKFASVASRYQPYPDAALDRAWRCALFNQAYGILGGRVVPAAAEDALALYGQVEELLRRTLNDALRTILLHVDTTGFQNPVVVFNPLSWERDGAVYVPCPDARAQWVVRDGDGAFSRTQAVYDPQTETTNLLFVARKLPPFGYRTYSLLPSPEEVSNPCSAEDGLIRTPQFTITLDAATGDAAQIEATALAWQVLAGAGNQIQIYEDLGDSDGRPEFSGKSWTLGPAGAVQVVEKGPVRVGLRVRNRLVGERTTFVREVYATDGIPWVEFRTSIEWNAANKFVKASFPTGIAAGVSTWEVPYGAVERSNDGLERPAAAWVDVGDNRRGAALLNQTRHGYDVQKDGTLRLSLLRSPVSPARSDDGGNHLVAYALLPHLGSWQEGAVHRRAQEYNAPPIAMPVPPHGGALPPQASFFRVTPASVALTAVKRAEAGDGLALRLVETEGRAVSAELFSHWFLRGAFETNLLERNEQPLTTEGDLLKLEFRPFEIKTVVLRGWGYAPLR